MSALIISMVVLKQYSQKFIIESLSVHKRKIGDQV
jgi:hypothetical protein